jgi:hypothetical protein
MQSRRTAPHESAAFVVCAQGLRKACFPGPLDTNTFRPLAGPFFLDCSRTDRVAGGPPARRNLGTQSQGFHLFQESLFSFFPGLPLLQVLFPSFSSFFLGGSIGFPVPDNLGRNPGDGIVKVRLLQLALPDDDHAPAFSLQLSPDFLVPLLVPGNFGHPKLSVGFGNSIILTVLVAMPEAAMHEDNRSILGQNDIRPTREMLLVYPVAKTLTPQTKTQTSFRASVLGSIVRHTFETLFGCHGNLDCIANLHRIR